MTAEDLAIVKGLVSVAWADGLFANEETEVIEGLLAAYGASPSEATEVRSFAKTPRSLEDIELTELSSAGRRVLLQHAVLLTFVDGVQHEKEKALLEDLITQLRLSRLEAERVVGPAQERARALLSELR